MGIIELLVFVVAFFVFPEAHSVPPDISTDLARTLPLSRLLTLPKFIITLFMLLVGSISIG